MSDTPKRSLYDQMVTHAPHPFYLWPDGLVTPGTGRPTREELIAYAMLIPRRVMLRRANGPGYAQVGPTTHATREEAERAVDAFLPDLTNENDEKAEQDATKERAA